MTGTLTSIRVLDFSRFVSGAFCAQLLGELGAEVIKIEIPGGGDALRSTPPFTERQESYFFIGLNRDKKSITLDLRTKRGQEIARELVKKQHVLVENFSRGVMERFGLGYQELKNVNPALIYASVSGFGATGPYSSRPVYDTIAQAMGGLMAVTGFHDGPPVRTAPSIADYLAGLFAAIGVQAALRYMETTGEGQLVDISMQDCVWAITAMEFASTYFATGKIPSRLGNNLPISVPANVYSSKDGYVVIIAVTVGQWSNLLRAMGREDLVRLEKYYGQGERTQNRDEVNALVQGWADTKTVEEITNTLSRFHVPCSRILTIDQVANDPQILSREMIVEVDQLISGRVKMPGSVLKLSRTPGDASTPAPFLGEHNYEIYSGVLGYSEQEINKLSDEGII